MIRAAVFLLLAVLPIQAQAKEVSVFGIWCSSEGTVLEITAESLANFEHTTCEFDEVQIPAREIFTGMTCRSIHFDDASNPVVTQENRYKLTAQLLSDQTVALDYSDGKGPFEFGRCEDG